MSVRSRFAGFDSPAALVADASLTRTQKISALHAWRNDVERAAGSGSDDAQSNGPLLEEIDRAMRTVRGG